MKMRRFVFLVLFTFASHRAPGATPEQSALAVLQSAASVEEKESACLRLKQCATAKAVPALSSLLADDALAQHALNVLETLPVPEAGDALLGALPNTKGKTRAGVLHALGVRQDARVVKEAAKLIYDPDVLVARAAAQTLGKIGNTLAVTALQSAHKHQSSPAPAAVADALLECAERLLETGHAKVASTIYQELRSPNEPVPVRVAAVRGVIISGDKARTELLVKALQGNDELEQAVAVQLVRDLPDKAMTLVGAGMLKKVTTLVEVALLGALSQRSDPAAAEAVETETRSGKPEVRIAALQALGELGDASHVALLAERAVGGPPEEQGGARTALTMLHRGDVLDAIAAEIEKGRLDVKVELISALARRAENRAIPGLLRWAGDTESRLSVAALQALEKLAGEAQAEPLLSLLLRAPEDDSRAAAVSAFVTVAGRSGHPAEFSARALRGLLGASTKTRCALLTAAGQIGGPGVLDALNAAATDANAEVQATARRTMAENGGDEARPFLLEFAREAQSDDDRSIALRGYWRLVEAMTDRPGPERLAAVRDGLATLKTTAELKAGLARLAELGGPEALELAQQYRRDTTVRAEAESACFQIASRFDATQFAAAINALNDLAAHAENQRIRSEAKALVSKLEAQAGYITPWLVSGPYRQEGKEAQQLFDVVFAPESPGAGAATWRPLPASSGLANFWRADLDSIVGGNHCVVYLKARVSCPKEQPVALEIGSDDGVKLWINGTLVHANNAVRGFTAGEDKAKGTLKEGANDFLVKITQHTAGCAAAVRVRAADGSMISGLRVEAAQ